MARSRAQTAADVTRVARDHASRGSAARRMGRALEPLLGVAAFFAAWAYASHRIANANLLPSPLAVGRAFVGMLDSELPKDIAASLAHLAIGYGFGAALGLLLALATVRSRWIEAIVDPYVEFLRPIGAIAWIPIAILIFGVGPAVPVFLIFYAAVFPIFVNT